MRQPLASIVDYNRAFVGEGRDPQWLKIKLDRLCASPFGFLRGTFHLFAADWATLGDDPLGPGPAQPIVGDVHLENFGAYRAADGKFVFDVNDFDETAPGPAALDLCRLATSFLLADEKHGDLRAVVRIESFLEAYFAEAQAGAVEPITAKAKSLPQAIKDVLAEAEEGKRAEWIDRRVETVGGKRRFKHNDKYQPVDGATERAVIDGVFGFAKSCAERPADCPRWPQVRDVASRIAGTGSLGRFRYAVLLPGKGDKPGKELVLELKEARPSSLDPTGSASAEAERVVDHVRRLQGDPPAYLGRTVVAGRAFTVRELQPVEAKIVAGEAKAGQLDEICAACGTVLARLHRRGATDLAARLKGRDRTIRRRVAAFALRYAELVCEDHRALTEARAKVEQQLGIA